MREAREEDDEGTFRSGASAGSEIRAEQAVSETRADQEARTEQIGGHWTVAFRRQFGGESRPYGDIRRRQATGFEGSKEGRRRCIAGLAAPGPSRGFIEKETHEVTYDDSGSLGVKSDPDSERAEIRIAGPESLGNHDKCGKEQNSPYEHLLKLGTGQVRRCFDCTAGANDSC